MKSATPQLDALLNSGLFVMADLYTFTLSSGAVFRVGSADIDLTWSGHAFPATRIKRGKTKTIVGVEVDELDVSIYGNATDAQGLTFVGGIGVGSLDGAVLQLERAFLPDWQSPVTGTLIQFYGDVADIKFGRSEAQIKVKSLLNRLNIQMPRNLYQPGCLHTLYDAGCGLNKAALGVAATLQSGSTATALHTGLAQADGYFALGTVLFTSGQNVGASYTVKTHAGGVLTPSRPIVVAPAAGDTVVVYPGCDKRLATCSAKFGNLGKFRGYPFVPAPETAY
ncbi:MAG: DUF2163 domain-containing protein [Rhodocyclaceae bacterium]|nr:DUF2163 domain-containing protein [Rhodocyclaceae bacterium]